MFEVDQFRLLGGVALAALVLAFVLYAAALLGALSRRARLRSGDILQTNRAVSEEVALGTSPRTFRSFAHAALGEFSSARRGLLDGAELGEIAARDYGLCSCVLIAAFENDSSRALGYAVELALLPLEGERHHARRSAVISVARVLAGVVEDEDWEYLNAAPALEPVMLWPCRYAVASLLCASGHREQVKRLIGSAPRWPETSHFSRLHTELLGRTSVTQGQPEAA